MKITETRKQIIEVIHPFMDKTLSEGCLFFRNSEIILSWDVQEDRGMFWGIYELELSWTYIKDCEIIGHYDITAFLNYIRSIEWYRVDLLDDNLFSIQKFDWGVWNWIAYIDSKPLHLYSEKEEKDWLKLLKELWTNNKQ